jgi:drug/metabolite transporter (DMT)-like permease
VNKISLQVWIGLTITVIADSIGQIIWKSLAGQLPDTDHIPTLLLAAVQMPYFWVLVGLLLAQLFLWLAVLKRADLSFAQPLTSMSYVGVGLLSYFWLGEMWTMRTVISVVLILIGVGLVSASSANVDSEKDLLP